MKQLLTPCYVKDFKCIGASCPDTCCAQWQVGVDKATFKKYRQLKPSLTQLIIDKQVKRQRGEEINDANYAYIKLDGNQACPLLTEDKWCQIHKNLGEEYLCKTCKEYPRQLSKVNEIYEFDMTLSCPEVASLVLSFKEGISFELDEVEKLPISSLSFTMQPNGIAPQKWQDLFELFRLISISVLQNRSYSIEERIVLLTIGYDLFMPFIKNHDVEQLELTMVEFYNMIDEDEIKQLLNGFKTEKVDLWLLVVKEILSQRLSLGIGISTYHPYFLSAVNVFGITPEGEINENVNDLLKDGVKKYYDPFIKEHEHILENYLVHQVYHSNFPLKYESPMEHLGAIVANFALIKFHLVAIGLEKEKIEFNDVVSLIQSYSKTFEHSQYVQNHVLSYLKKQNRLTVGDIAALISC